MSVPRSDGAQTRIALRATPMLVGGVHARVWFASKSEDRPFVLDVERESAPLIGGFLYAELDIEALVTRDDDGAIRSGKLVRFDVVASEGATDAWRGWYAQHAAEWDRVADVEGELGRDRA